MTLHDIKTGYGLGSFLWHSQQVSSIHSNSSPTVTVTSIYLRTLCHGRVTLVQRRFLDPRSVRMLAAQVTLACFLILLIDFRGMSFIHNISPKLKCKTNVARGTSKTVATRKSLYQTSNNGPDERSTRKIAKYDNLGDPIYEDELNASGSSGITIFGKKFDTDPISASLLVFAVIAIQFFSVLFFQ